MFGITVEKSQMKTLLNEKYHGIFSQLFNIGINIVNVATFQSRRFWFYSSSFDHDCLLASSYQNLANKKSRRCVDRDVAPVYNWTFVLDNLCDTNKRSSSINCQYHYFYIECDHPNFEVDLQKIKKPPIQEWLKRPVDQVIK